MAANRLAYDLSNLYRQHQLSVRARALLLLQRAWGLINPADLDATFNQTLPVVVNLVQQAERQAIALSPAYVAAFVETSIGTPVERQAVTVLESPPAKLAAIGTIVGAATIRRKVAAGMAADQATQEAFVRAARAYGSLIMQAGRASLVEAMDLEPRVVGYERVTSLNPCPVCTALSAGGLRHTAQAIEVHPDCGCTAEPVVENVRDTVRRPRGAELTPAA